MELTDQLSPRTTLQGTDPRPADIRAAPGVGRESSGLRADEESRAKAPLHTGPASR